MHIAQFTRYVGRNSFFISVVMSAMFFLSKMPIPASGLLQNMIEMIT